MILFYIIYAGVFSQAYCKCGASSHLVTSCRIWIVQRRLSRASRQGAKGPLRNCMQLRERAAQSRAVCESVLFSARPATRSRLVRRLTGAQCLQCLPPQTQMHWLQAPCNVCENLRRATAGIGARAPGCVEPTADGKCGGGCRQHCGAPGKWHRNCGSQCNCFAPGRWQRSSGSRCNCFAPGWRRRN